MDNFGHKKELRDALVPSQAKGLVRVAQNAFVVLVQHFLALALFTSFKFAAL
jgi:hypothetical protein